MKPLKELLRYETSNDLTWLETIICLFFMPFIYPFAIIGYRIWKNGRSMRK